MMLSSILFTGLSMFVAVLAYLSYKDLKTGEIPPATIYSLFTITFVLGIFAGAEAGAALVDIFAAMLFGGGAFFLVGYIIFLFGGFGGGDVKLLGAIGAFLGLVGHLGFVFNTVILSDTRAITLPYFVLYVINLGVIALPYSLGYIALAHRGRKDDLIQLVLTRDIFKFPIPFAPVICMSFILMFL